MQLVLDNEKKIESCDKFVIRYLFLNVTIIRNGDPYKITSLATLINGVT